MPKRFIGCQINQKKMVVVSRCHVSRISVCINHAEMSGLRSYIRGEYINIGQQGICREPVDKKLRKRSSYMENIDYISDDFHEKRLALAR